MADSSEKETDRVVIDVTTLHALRPETIARLKNEFGATFELRASKEGLAALLDSVNKGSIPVGLGKVAEYDRGFDRTNPGYDKFYDRDKASLVDSITNPVVNKPELDLLKVSKVIR
jgi:hypothetical protein